MTLAELQQMRARLANEMRDYNNAQGDAEWGAEQRDKWAQMRTDIQKLDEKIKREEELRNFEQSYVEERGTTDNRSTEGADTDDELRAQAFGTFLRDGIGGLSSEQRQVMRGDEQRAQAAGVNDKGGFTVPRDFIAQVHESMSAYGGIASVAHILVTDRGNIIEWPVSEGVTEEGELLGENSEAGEGDVTFGMDILGSHKLSSKIIRVSNELMNDTAIDMERYLAGRIASRIGRAEARYIVQGTGSGTPVQPKGLEASTAVGASTAAAAVLAWKEINALIHSVDPAYRQAPKFRLAFNDKTLKIVEEMEDDKKRPLWLPGLTQGAPATILGREYVVDQGIADIGAGKKFMYAGDFEQFVIRRIRYMTLRRLTERYIDFDQTGFLAFHRFGCVLQDKSAIRALQGKAA
jgi:HK97 family phage major capsid protein